MPLRPVVTADAPQLIAAFLEAFRDTPEYYGWPEADRLRSAHEHIEGYFAGRRGVPLEASHVAVEEGGPDGSGAIVGAALLVREEAGPLLSLLFVRPAWQRHG